MRPLLLPATERRAQPWKNGGGVTREIAAHPEGADLATFDWRISTATVASSGPFSQFPGVDRILLVLDGGLALRISGAETRVLRPGDEPLAFPGDIPVEARLAAGPVTDLNIMVRRGVWRAQVRRLAIDRATWLPAVEDGVQFFVALGALAIEGAALHAADAVRFEAPLPVEPVSGPADLILINLSRIP